LTSDVLGCYPSIHSHKKLPGLRKKHLSQKNKFMSQTRIVVSARLKPLAQELVMLTGVDSLSDLLSLLLTKYGHHLKNTWEMVPQQQVVNPEVCSVNQIPTQGFIPVAAEPQNQQPYSVQEIELTSESLVQEIERTFNT
jgi:hypothetical protein